MLLCSIRKVPQGNQGGGAARGALHIYSALCIPALP